MTAGTGEYIIVYDITNLRDLINSVVPTYYGIKDDAQNQLDDINLYAWSANDEKMFAGYTPEERKEIGLENVAVGDIKPIEGVARMIDKSEKSETFFLTPDDILGPFDYDNAKLKSWLR